MTTTKETAVKKPASARTADYIILEGDGLQGWQVVGKFPGRSQYEAKRAAVSRLVADKQMEEGQTVEVVAVPAKSWKPSAASFTRPDPVVAVS